MRPALLPWAAALWAVPALAADLPVSTVVLFDSICLACHEGECSGRMALRKDKSQSGLAGHVAGYAGPQDPRTVADLALLMERLKTGCRLPPPPVAVPADGSWSPARLAQVMLPDRRRAFLPLGTLAPGPHQLRLGLEQGRRIRVQVVADSFDIVLDEDMEVGAAGTLARWRVDEAGEYFLRLIAREPMAGLSVAR